YTPGMTSTTILLHRQVRHRPATALFALLLASAAPALLHAQTGTSVRRSNDLRVGLGAGWNDAQEAASSLTLLAHRPRPEGFYNPKSVGDFNFVNADMAFRGNLLFQGGFNGFQVWDISNPANPTLRT